MAKAKPRIRVPKKVSKGEIIEIKTLISHKMETGQRKDKKTGKVIPRKIINKFVVKFEDKEIFAADLYPAVSANPYVSFNMRADKSGNLKFEWHDDDGTVYAQEKKLDVQ